MRDVHYYSNIVDLFYCLFIDTSSEFDNKTIMNISHYINFHNPPPVIKSLRLLSSKKLRLLAYI